MSKHKSGDYGGGSYCPNYESRPTCPHCCQHDASTSIEEAIASANNLADCGGYDVPKAVAALKEAHSIVNAATWRAKR